MQSVSSTINNIQKQFLCGIPVKNYNFQNIINDLDIELQETIINKTVNSELIRKYPVSIDYQKHFVKYFIHELELQNSVIHDEWYEIYGRLVTQPSNENSIFKHYICRNSPSSVITLKENINLISEGTTGLRTWQASLALSEWCLKNANKFHNKTILELGSGIGLCTLTAALGCIPSTVIATDCHSAVLNVLCENIHLNTNPDEQLHISSNDKCLLKKLIRNSSCEIRVEKLAWQDVNVNVCKSFNKIDYILAADVVYDKDLFEPLINTLTLFFVNCQVDKAIFACTVRNKLTLDKFLEKIRAASFNICELEIPEQENFIWPTDTPVKIFSFEFW